MPEPIVSIISPLFNKGQYVEEMMRSVVRQTIDRWELIVVENGSRDDGPTRVEDMARRDRRITLRSCTRRGPGAARNLGLRVATGEWCLFLDADDLIDPHYLSSLLAVAASEACGAIVAAGWTEFLDGAPPESGSRMNLPASCEPLRYTSIAYPPWPLSAAIVRREAMTKDRCWDEDLDQFISEDTAFWFRLLQFNRPFLSEVRGFRYRLKATEGRNNFYDLSGWLHGIRRVHESNRTFLERNQLAIHWRHMESLMRIYSSVWERASAEGNLEIAEGAISSANEWLRQAFMSGGWKRPGVFARRAVGIRNFQRLSKLRSRLGRDYRR